MIHWICDLLWYVMLLEQGFALVSAPLGKLSKLESLFLDSQISEFYS